MRNFRFTEVFLKFHVTVHPLQSVIISADPLSKMMSTCGRVKAQFAVTVS
jgi:hypothetical protein